MRIGICKLGIDLIDIYDVDTNGRFKEMIALYEIFKARGHVVSLIDTKSLVKHDYKFDKIFILNGILDKNAIVDTLAYSKKAHELNYIVTDLRLVDSIMSQLFDNVLTQSIRDIPWIKAPQSYNGMPELACYDCSYKPTYKDIEFIFGGGIRDREIDFKNYFDVDDSNLKLLIKDSTRDTRVPINEYHSLLARSKYSLIINDKEYNDNGFITWRYYENICNDVITFLDSKVDKDNIIQLNPIIKTALTTTDYNSMKKKMNSIDNLKDLEDVILKAQRDLITKDMITGSFTYNKLQREG